MKNKILEKVQKLKYKDDSVIVSDVYPAMLESIFDLTNGINVVGGRDLDYEGETAEYQISGSAYYGTCEFIKKHGVVKPKIETKTNDKYTRTSFKFANGSVEYTPPAICCDDDMKEQLSDEYNLYYIGFSSRGITTLYPFYSKYERNVRWRALSIWGRYDGIYTESQLLYIKSRHGENFDKFYHIQKDTYVIMDERNE